MGVAHLRPRTAGAVIDASPRTSRTSPTRRGSPRRTRCSGPRSWRAVPRTSRQCSRPTSPSSPTATRCARPGRAPRRSRSARRLPSPGARRGPASPGCFASRGRSSPTTPSTRPTSTCTSSARSATRSCWTASARVATTTRARDTAGGGRAHVPALGHPPHLHRPDHILFIVGLLLLGGSALRMLKIVTAFTLAHSVTLALATLGAVTPPARWWSRPSP